MKKQILLSFVLILALINGRAQGPYTSANFGVAGDALFYTSVNVNNSSLNFGQAGANVTWNFASLTPTTQYGFNFINPLTSGYDAAFLAECTAGGRTLAQCNTQFNALTNLAFRDIGNLNIQGTIFTNQISEDLKTAGSLKTNIFGATTNINGAAVRLSCNYSSPDVVFVFPINYGNQDSSTSAYNIDLTPQNINFIYHVHSKRVNYADAYGTLTTPFATYNSTVRERSYIYHTDTLFYYGTAIVIAPYTSFEYSWFDASYTGPVFTATGRFNGANQNFQTVTYLDTIRCLAPVASRHRTPNPAIIDPSVGHVVVDFTNTSTNANSYEWNFGDPSSGLLDTSSAINPQHQYDNNGVYHVELIACNTACIPAACDTDSTIVTVLDSTQIHAAFVINPAIACAHDVVRFTNNSTNATSYTWNFGDNATSNGTNPTHTYTQAGTYTIVLVAHNGNRADTVRRTLVVNASPNAQITASGPLNFCNGDSVTLQASGGLLYTWSTGHNGPSIKVKNSGTFTVTATNSCGNSVSTPVIVTVNIPVDTIIAHDTTTVCSGDSVLLTVNASAGATYQWKRGGQIITGATQTSYYASTTGNYRADVTVNGCVGESNIIHVTVRALPTASISTNGNTTICSGDSVKLVATTGTNYTYQWQNNGQPISGATASTYYANTNGSFIDVVTHNGCSVNSNSIIISQNATPAPVITVQGPTSTCQGDSIYLSTIVDNGATYQWTKGGNAIAGATSFFFYADSTGNYKVAVTANGCTGKSTATNITVHKNPTANAGNNDTLVGCSFTSATLGGNPTASRGTGPYSYLWSPSVGLSSNTVANPVVSQLGSSVHYNLIVTDSNGCTASDSVTVVVTGNNLSVAINYTGDTTWCFGTADTVFLNAVITGGSSPFIYNWSPAGTLSSTGSDSTVASPTVVGAYDYTVVVIDHNGCQASANLPVTVAALPVATVTALDTTAPCAGDSVHFVAAPGTGYVYQWLNAGNSVTGANAFNFTVADAGSYAVSVTAGICSATSSPVVVTVRPEPVASVSVHGGTTLCAGNSAVLSATSGNGYSYQWYQNGYGIGGATSASYTAQDSGSYFADVTLNGCTVTSDTVGISIIQYPGDSIGVTGPTVFCAGSSTELSVSTGTGYTYQWLNGTNYITGATDSTLIVDTTGIYAVLVTYNGCSSTSTGVQITVYQYPSGSLAANGSLNFCTGDSVQLNATSDNSYNYTWLNDVGGTLDTLPYVTSSITVGDSGTYYAVITQGACATVTDSVYANELSLPFALAHINGSGFTCPGDSVSLYASIILSYSYQWQLNGNNIPGATSAGFAATDSGTYAVLVTGGSCSALSNTVVVSYDSCTAVGLPVVVENESISVYPNPGHNAAVVSLTCKQAANISIKLFDLLGNQVNLIYEGKTAVGNNMFNIPMATLAGGIYLLRIYDGNAVVSKKLIKE